jgi:glyoxylase-like metal-dependent hydrolase (beta-lactamase superfamily II)
MIKKGLLVSNIQYAPLSTSPLLLDGGAMFGIIPKPLWSKAIVPDDQNRIPMTMRVLFIKEGNRIVLIDAGVGDYQGDKFNHRYGLMPLSFDQLLSSTDFTPADVTDVIITHLHFDHVSGLLTGSNLDITFPNAKLYIHEEHCRYAFHATMRDSGSFQLGPIKKILDYYTEKKALHLLKGQEGYLIENLSKPLQFKTTHGHTPYQILPYNDDFIFLADLIPTVHHAHIPWVMGYDLHPGETCVEKGHLLHWILQTKKLCLFEHDIHCWGAKLSYKEGIYSFQDQYNLDNTSGNFFQWMDFSAKKNN